jgi:cysteine synthase
VARGVIDDAVQVADPEALEQIYELQAQEGLSVGGSTGINVMAAILVARAMGPGHTVVTVLCDGGARYQSKLFNPEFLRERNLPVPSWLAA